MSLTSPPPLFSGGGEGRIRCTWLQLATSAVESLQELRCDLEKWKDLRHLGDNKETVEEAVSLRQVAGYYICPIGHLW